MNSVGIIKLIKRHKKQNNNLKFTHGNLNRFMKISNI